jgi:hypothetical protein
MTRTCFGPDALTGANGAGIGIRELDAAKSNPSTLQPQDILTTVTLPPRQGEADIQAAREWLKGALNLLHVIANDGLASDAISELGAVAGLIEEGLAELDNEKQASSAKAPLLGLSDSARAPR